MLVLYRKDLLSSRMPRVPRGWLRIELGRSDVLNSGNNGFPVNSGGGFCEDWTISETNKLFSRITQSSVYGNYVSIFRIF